MYIPPHVLTAHQTAGTGAFISVEVSRQLQFNTVLAHYVVFVRQYTMSVWLIEHKIDGYIDNYYFPKYTELTCVLHKTM